MAKNTLRFPILKNVEYLDIIKHTQTIKTFTKKDCENLSWRNLQKKVGELTSGMVNYTLKFNDSPELHKGTMRAVNEINSAAASSDDKQKDLLNEIESLKTKINSIGAGSGVSVELLLNISKQSYETQINFLNTELTRKENFIDKQQTKIETLENELNECYEQIEDLKGKTGLNQYVDLAKMFLSSKMPGAKKITSLKDSNSNDIPERILIILGAVDWSKVPSDVLDTIIQYLEMYITKLPLKGA
jgi:predicted RNase H-like nuclease (RuvC/YqgF family)